MFAIRVFAALFLTYIATVPAFAEPDFHSKVVELYSFEPHKLTNAEMQAKAGQLDQFWAMAKADPSNTLPLLRRELENPSNSAFFYYDGSKLLLALSTDRSDQALALRSIAKADLQGVQHSDYLKTVHWLASKGFDARDAAFRILAFPDFKAFIPQHALGSVDSKDSLLGANQIQGCFWEAVLGVKDRLVLSDAAWERMAPLIIGRPDQKGSTGRDNRMFVEGVLWIVRTGSPWRDLPEAFGDWNSVFRRFSRWSIKGVWWRIFEAMSDDPDFEYLIVDSTIVRAHQHAAGAKKGGLKIKRSAARAVA